MMSQVTTAPGAYSRTATQVVPQADVYIQATTPSGSSFKAIDNIGSKVGDKLNFQRTGDYWQNVVSNITSMSEKLTGYLSATGEGISLDKSKLKSELGSQFGNYSFINDLTDNQLDSLGGYMQSGGLQILYGSAMETRDLLMSDGLNASSIVSAAQSLLGASAGLKLINNSAIFGVANLVLDKLESTGALSLLDSVIEKVREERLLNELLEQRAIGAAGESNISLCRHYVDSMGYSRAHAIKEDIIPVIVGAYKLTAEDTRPYGARAVEIVGLLNAIDSGWSIGKPGLKTKYYHQFSQDCIKVFSCLEDTRKAALAIGCQTITGELDAASLSTTLLGVALSG